MKLLGLKPVCLIVAVMVATLALPVPQAAAYCAPGAFYATCMQNEQQQQMQLQRQQQMEMQRQQQMQMQMQQEQAERQRQMQMQQQQQEAERQRQLQMQQQAERQRQIQQQQQQQQQQAERQRQIQQQQQQQQQQAERQRQIQQQQQQQQQAERQRQIQQPEAQRPHPVQPAQPASQPHIATATAADRPVAPIHPTQAVTPTPARPVQLTGGTTVAPHRDGQGYTMEHPGNNGSRVVAVVQPVPNAPARLTAFAEHTEPGTGVRTRTYLNGNRIAVGPNFVTRSAPRQPTVTAFADGRRNAYSPAGRPLYHDQFASAQIAGRDQRVLVRTTYAGATRPVTRPVHTVYGVVWVGPVLLFPYYPAVFAPGFYQPLLVPFGTPLVVTAGCPYCPPPGVAFAQAITAYTDAVTLLSDWQIASGFADGLADDPPALLPPPDTETVATLAGNFDDSAPPLASPSASAAELDALSQQVAALQQQVAREAAENDSLQAQLRAQAVPVAAPAATPPKPRPPPVAISQPVRDQMRQQVRDEIDLHQQQKPLSLAALLAGDHATSYLFQVSGGIDTTSLATGEECALGGGDLLRLAQPPADGDASATMTVVTSQSLDCKAGTQVAIALPDLQTMLNQFSLRLENNMQRVHDQIALATP